MQALTLNVNSATDIGFNVREGSNKSLDKGQESCSAVAEHPGHFVMGAFPTVSFL
jgi:hypothetical protein